MTEFQDGWQGNCSFKGNGSVMAEKASNRGGTILDGRNAGKSENRNERVVCKMPRMKRLWAFPPAD